MVEVVESRQLLCSGPISQATGLGVIAGTAFVDLNCDGKLSTTDVYLPGATVQLFKPGQCTPLLQTKTDCYGGYSFNGLQPGDYIVKEIPPCGYSNSGTQVNSQLDPGQSLSCQTMKVTVVDPNSIYVNYQGIQSTINGGATDKYAVADLIVNNKGDNPQYVPQTNAIGPMTLTLGTSAGATDLNTGLTSDCADLEKTVNFSGPQSFQVIPTATIGLTGNADSSGRIAYLFNHYGNSSLTNVTGPALQLAIWELLYDGNEQKPDFWGGNFQLNGTPADIQTTGGANSYAILDQATEYYNESAGHREAAAFLKTKTSDTTGQQSMLAQESFNFANTANCSPLYQQTGTTTFWTSCNGQNLIKGFNGGGCSTQLANWLATTFPNLYGPGTGGCVNPYDLTGKTNSDVACLMQQLVGTTCWSIKPEAQVLATVLSDYASTSSLGGCTGASFGFRITAGGLGSVNVNVGCAGSALGVGNCAPENVSTLLTIVNASAKNGLLFGGNSCLSGRVASLFGSINQWGSIDGCQWGGWWW